MKSAALRFLLLLTLLFPGVAGTASADDYDAGDYARFPQASSKINNNLRIGALVDADNYESGGLLGGILGAILDLIFPPNATATSDDAFDSDDEDGVVVPLLIAQGGTINIPVTVFNKTGKNAYLNAWVDFNNDGTLNNTIYTTAGGEKITSQITVASANQPSTRTISFVVPKTAVTGTARGIRVRLTSNSDPGPDGSDGEGEVEDYVFDVTTPGYCYGIAEGKIYEINMSTGAGKYLANMAVSGTGNGMAFTRDLGADGVLVYTTGMENDLRLGVWDRTTNAGNNAGNLSSFGGPKNGVIRCGAWYGGHFWFILDETDDLYKVALTGTSGNYRITGASKVCDLWSNNRDHVFGDFIVQPDGTALAIARRENRYPEFFTFNLTQSKPSATLLGTPPVMQNGIALGLDAKIYGGLGLDSNNSDWYTISSTNGSVTSTIGGSNLDDVADMTIAAPWAAPAANPLLDYGDFSRFGTAGSLAINTLRMGGMVDGESSAASNAAATADDTANSDDEDGAVVPAVISAGETVTIPVTVLNKTGASAWLSAWLDFNNDGTLNNSLYTTSGGERLMNQITIPSGNDPVIHEITFTVPSSASPGTGRGVRFRLNSTSGQGPTNSSGNGEVEDYVVTIESVSLTATMQVRPVGTTAWSSGIAVPAGSEVECRMTLTNSGFVTLRDPVVIDILPGPGDTRAIDATPRDSAWKLLLNSAATVPAGVTAFYSVQQNPQRPEVLTPNPSGSQPPAWATSLPENPAAIRSLKFDGTGLTLAAGASVTISWNLSVPWDAVALTSAYNTAGVAAVRSDTGTALPPVESSPASVQALAVAGPVYGDRVWADANGDGLQTSGENGIDGVLVEFYRDNGDSLPDPLTDTKVSSTFTATVSGQPGTYRFGYFTPGNYFAVVTPPDAWIWADANTGSNRSVDSDVQTLIRNGRRLGVMPVTGISAGETDLAWDAGLCDRSGVPAVWAMAESSDGRIVMGGRFTKSHGVSRKNIVRVDAAGRVDTTFNPGSGFDSTVRSIALRSDGMIWVGGDFTSYNGSSARGVALLNASGAWDSRAAQPDSSTVNWVGASGNLMYLAGSFRSVGGISCGNVARLKADGTVDTGFNQGSGANGTVFGGAVLSTGELVLVGGFSTFNSAASKGVVRLKSDGKVDNSFNIGSGAKGEVYSVKPLDDGRMILTGNFTSFDGTDCNGTVRLNKNGKVDSTMKQSTLNVGTISTSN